jgi:amino acid adenylation domain-containing protein
LSANLSSNDRLAGLSAEKRALLQRKLMEKRKSDGSGGIRRRMVGTSCPLSCGQELMWLLEQLTPGISSYNVPRTLRLEGQLDLDALRRVLNEIVRRHEVLRTNYETVDGKPVQIVRPSMTVPLDPIDLSGLDRQAQEAETQRLAVEWSDRSFDLSRDLFFRSALLRLSDREHILILVSHHIASDGWSKGILFREMEVVYEAFCKGGPSPLPEPALQYADFAVWQKSWLTGPALENLLGYWRRQLAGAPPLLELPTDHPRPLVQSGRGRRVTTRFSGTLARALKELGRQEGATLFMTALATFQVLLCRYTGQEDVVVGTPVSGRTRTEMEGIVGYFSNSLALRTSLAGDPTFRELLGRVREVTLGAYSHQEMPFEKLVVELNPERTLRYSPIYQVMFTVVTAQMEELKLPGLTVSGMFSDRGTAKFDLTLGMRDTGQELLAGVEYNADLFESATMERLLGHYRTLLEAVAADPERRISQLPLLTEQERQKLLEVGTGPRRDYPLDQCWHELFEAQAMKSPDAVAVECGERTMTYRELMERANQLANSLRKTGVGRGDFVAVLKDRGPEFLIAMLAIFEAGGAYVPIEPSYPRDRIRYLLTHGETQTLLTDAALANRFADVLRDCRSLKTLICFDAVTSDTIAALSGASLNVHGGNFIEGFSLDRIANVNVPTDPLYMIFTSGSTGLPKGAVIRHDGAVNHIFAQLDALQLSSPFAFLQTAPSCSDISVWQFLAPLLTGGRTVIVDDATLLDPRKLFATIRQRRISIVELVPVVLKLLTDHVESMPPQQRALPNLKWLMVTGEEVPPALVNAWLTFFPEIKVVNAYGPTEAADDVLQAIIQEPVSTAQRSVPIGKPLANVSIRIVDEHLQLTPWGVPGEICVAGVGVGAGYWKDEERTRGSFVADPFEPAAGRLLYKTGDLGKWLNDGTVEFLGRKDHQVKIHGFRIELGEIEATLRRHPGIRDAVVVVREEEPGKKRLVAYTVSSDSRPTIADFKEYLKRFLPAYMIPTAFVALPAIPVTPNGKVDRAALPAPSVAGHESRDGNLAPRTPFEKALAAIWMEVLGIESVGIQDNFFELGGHSLLATQVMSRLRERFQTELELRDLFEAPTIAELATVLVDRLTQKTIP